MSIRAFLIMLTPWLLIGAQLQAQKNPSQPGSPQGQSPSPSGGGAAPATGITWPSSVWDSLTNIDSQKGSLGIAGKDHPLYLLCYSLDITTGSLSTPPFVLHQVDSMSRMGGQSCISTAKSKKPLLARGFLGVAIDARHVPIWRMRSFNLTLTTAAGQPINLYPVRPSVSAASTGGSTPQTATNKGGSGEGPSWGKLYYLIWPQELGGDVIPTVTVSLSYTPPVPGSPWQTTTVYPEGSVVTPSAKLITVCDPIDSSTAPPLSGHYFAARTGGISSPNVKNTPKFCVKAIPDGTTYWLDSGTMLPTNAPAASSSPSQGATQPAKDAAPATIGNWTSAQPYPPGTAVYYPVTSHYYIAAPQDKTGTSGPEAPFSDPQLVTDGGVSWFVFGRNPPPVGATPAEWAPNTIYNQDKQTVYDAATQLYFTAVFGKGLNSGKSGSENPFEDYFTKFQILDPAPGPVAPGMKPPAAGPAPVHWIDVGSTAPVLTQPLKVATPLRTINTPYSPGDVVFDPNSGHFFTSITLGRSGPALLPFPANQSHLIPDGAPVFALKENFMSYDINLDSGQLSLAPVSGEWNSKEDPDTGDKCANSGTSYPEFLPVGAAFHNFDCIRDQESGTLFQLKADSSLLLVPAIPANFGFVPPPIMVYSQDLLNGSNDNRTGFWIPKANADASPRCANQIKKQYPNFSDEATYHNQDCYRAQGAAQLFQLRVASNEPLHAAAGATFTAIQPVLLKPIAESFLDKDGQFHALGWTVAAGPTPIGCKTFNDKGLSYEKGTCVTVPGIGTPFLLNTVGAHGSLTPYPQQGDFSAVAAQLTHTQSGLSQIQWEDIGTSVPSLVSSGEPADQTIAQAYTVTQVHPLYYFNLSTGLVASTTHTHTYGWATNAPGMYTPIQTASNPIIDPVLFFTVYWPGPPMDAESQWSAKNLIPAPTLGMSFISPTSNFYMGLSSEVRRNVQIVFGMSTAEPQYLSSTSVSATNTGTPPTAQHFTRGGFIGFSLNISGFIQTVLGGK